MPVDRGRDPRRPYDKDEYVTPAVARLTDFYGGEPSPQQQTSSPSLAHARREGRLPWAAGRRSSPLLARYCRCASSAETPDRARHAPLVPSDHAPLGCSRVKVSYAVRQLGQASRCSRASRASAGVARLAASRANAAACPGHQSPARYARSLRLMAVLARSSSRAYWRWVIPRAAPTSSGVRSSSQRIAHTVRARRSTVSRMCVTSSATSRRSTCSLTEGLRSAIASNPPPALPSAGATISSYDVAGWRRSLRSCILRWLMIT